MLTCTAGAASASAQESAGDSSKTAADSQDKEEQTGAEENSSKTKEEKKSPETEPPPRPPAFPQTTSPRVPWQRHIEFGGGVAMALRPSSDPSGIRYAPALGVGVHARWNFFDWLRFNIYFVGAVHDVRIPLGALGTPGEVTGDDPGTLPRVDTLAFGARLAPTLPLGDRARSWIGVGIGYGRFGFGKMTIREGQDLTYVVRQRAMSFAEVPVSLGTSVDIIKGWFTIESELTFGIALGQGGTATEDAQTIRAGARQNVGPLPQIDFSVVHTLGLAIVL